MVIVPMRVKRWNWNEVKSEELAGLSVALVGPSPWDPETSFKFKCLVMPLLPKLRKQIFTSTIAELRFASRKYTH